LYNVYCAMLLLCVCYNCCATLLLQRSIWSMFGVGLWILDNKWWVISRQWLYHLNWHYSLSESFLDVDINVHQLIADDISCTFWIIILTSPVDINDATNVLILLILFLMLLDFWRSPVNFQVIYESDIMEAAVTSELQLLDVLTLTFKLQARIL